MHNLIMMRKYADEAEQELTTEIARLENVLEKAPAGRLIVANNNGVISYYVSEGDKRCKHRSYIRKNEEMDTITSLGDKRFAEVSIDKLRKLLVSVRKFKHNYFFLLDLADDFEAKNIPTTETTFLSREQFSKRWKDTEYEPLGEVKGNELDITAMCGIKVRSKAEATIADILHDMGVVFKYEEEYQHKNGTIVFPDFKIVHPITGQIIIYEHFGRMDDPDYVNRNLRKIDEYREDGLKLDETFIFTFETKKHPISPYYIKRMLERVLSF